MTTTEKPARRRAQAAPPTEAVDVAQAVTQARAKVAATKKRHELSREAFNKTVALAVSSEPNRIDWYDHPGPLDRRIVMEAAGLTTVALHRLMERYRLANPPKRRRR